MHSVVFFLGFFFLCTRGFQYLGPLLAKRSLNLNVSSSRPFSLTFFAQVASLASLGSFAHLPAQLSAPSLFALCCVPPNGKVLPPPLQPSAPWSLLLIPVLSPPCFSLRFSPLAFVFLSLRHCPLFWHPSSSPHLRTPPGQEFSSFCFLACARLCFCVSAFLFFPLFPGFAPGHPNPCRRRKLFPSFLGRYCAAVGVFGPAFAFAAVVLNSTQLKQ